MESFQNDTVFLEDDDEPQEFQHDEEEHDDDDDNRPSTTTASFVVAMPVPVSVVSNTSSARAVTVATASPEPKQEQFEEKKVLDDSRRLFQRLWTDEDEIELLQGFLDYTAKRGSSHHNDTALFYDQIKSKLQLDCNKNQLVEKLRRLKKKYRNALTKIASGKEFSFKSPHDQATFEISRKIWGNSAPIGGSVEDDDEINLNPNSAHTTPLKNDAIIEKKTPPSRKRSRIETEEKRELNDSSPLKNNNNDNNYYNTTTNGDNCNGKNSVQSLIEETVRSCLSPVLKELASNAMGSCRSGFGGRGFELNTMPLRFLNLGNGETLVDEKWRKQQILELEVYSKRLELVQDEIKVALEELQSAGAGGVDKV